MPRVIITTDHSTLPHDISVLLDEHVSSVHLSTDHAASQLIERIAWAITDAEDAERTAAGRAPTSPTPTPYRRSSRGHAQRRPGTVVAGR
jgi:hypothetical protein